MRNSNRRLSVCQLLVTYYIGYDHPNPRLKLECLLQAFEEIDQLCEQLDEILPA